ncbi:MAG TPA: cupin domain-containing protein [Pyrinomonadaceae bacterium]|jgi:mannose-6-phosphate isomerase-like protein (cupin superfamily)|nr:cupin domain-containing protein [Pyrinomonadaceae bacterium]
MRSILFASLIAFGCVAVSAQTRQPSTASRPFTIKSKQQLAEIEKSLAKQAGNKSEDIIAAVGMQTRIAIFHDEKREGDNVELHDGSDDIYYVLGGTATLMLGGKLDEPKEISPGEWRSKSATGSEKVVIKKGDLVFVPRGTPHQRTVTGKDFSMILVKIFSENQPSK